jgi:hypothetical protein
MPMAAPYAAAVTISSANIVQVVGRHLGLEADDITDMSLGSDSRFN